MLELQGGINEWITISVQIGKQNKWALNQFIRKKKGKKIFTWGKYIIILCSEMIKKPCVFPAISQWLLISLFPNSFFFLPIFQFFKCVFTKFWRRQCHPTPVLLPGKSHGWRGLVGCSPQGREESDTTERLHFLLSPSQSSAPFCCIQQLSLVSHC